MQPYMAIYDRPEMDLRSSITASLPSLILPLFEMHHCHACQEVRVLSQPTMIAIVDLVTTSIVFASISNSIRLRVSQIRSCELYFVLLTLFQAIHLYRPHPAYTTEATRLRRSLLKTPK